jgi:hypothetical protein
MTDKIIYQALYLILKDDPRFECDIGWKKHIVKELEKEGK